MTLLNLLKSDNAKLLFTTNGNVCTVELVQSDTSFFWHPTKIYGPKVFLLTKIKPEFSDILRNPTHSPGPLLGRIRQVPLYCKKMKWFK